LTCLKIAYGYVQRPLLLCSQKGTFKMKAELVKLHDKMLSEARTRVQSSIEKWRKALEIVKEAERQAQCQIVLPEPLVKRLPEVVQLVESAVYLLSLQIEREAVESRKEIIDFSRNFLEQRVKNSESAAHSAKQAVEKAAAERKRALDIARNITKR
jgi:Fe2+ transport system protein B